MTTIEAYARIQSGVLVIHNRQRLDSDLKQCIDCDVKITIRKRGRKSLIQLGYYWGVVIPEIRLKLTEMGYRITDEKVHESMMRKFYPVIIYDEQGTVILEEAGSTKDFNKTDFSELIDKVRQWAWESLQLAIPDPDKNHNLFNS